MNGKYQRCSFDIRLPNKNFLKLRQVLRRRLATFRACRLSHSKDIAKNYGHERFAVHDSSLSIVIVLGKYLIIFVLILPSR